MAPLPPLLVPDSSVKALISQQGSSSSPPSSIESPSLDSTTEPSLPASSPTQHASHIRNSQIDISLPSSSPTSSNLVPEITPVPQSKGLRRRRKTKQPCVQRKDNMDRNVHHARQDRRKQAMPRRDSADYQKKKGGCDNNLCCKCMAVFTADCAAVCCCPLALLHLAALTFIRLPTAVAWKMLVNLKNKIYTKRQSTKASEEDSPRPNFANSWSYGSSPEGRDDPRLNVVRFDSENLWQHFEAGSLDFGGLSKRRELS